ncbi:MAG TPA: phosphoribosyltransferase family protein [Chitinophagaceae bacterium]|nr:phosphoribosyltransferase family protein [Chitinophagaceae bacterium]
MSKNYILTAGVADKKLRRMAYEILENNADEPLLILAGIRESGSVIARAIQKILGEISSINTELIAVSLDKKRPAAVELSQSPDLNNKVVILVDDVANSGKTLTYALKPLLEFHPKKIQTLVLVERSHKKFPVQPDYVGLSVATTMQEHIFVEVEGEAVTGAYLE